MEKVKQDNTLFLSDTRIYGDNKMKVYCDNCFNYRKRLGDGTAFCRIIDKVLVGHNAVKEERFDQHLECDVANKNNNCIYYTKGGLWNKIRNL
jgi:hypothetical protein